MPSYWPATPTQRGMLLVTVLVLLLTSGGCGVMIGQNPKLDDSAVVGPVDTSIVRGADGGPIDVLAAATALDLQSYWRATFEDTFEKPWRDISGGFHSVDTSDQEAPPPPCLRASAQVKGNAFYCAAADAIAWDRAELFPALRERNGDGGVVVVLAHEMGHAVHNRLGIDQEAERRQPGRYPTVLTEAMADCYAGSFVRWVAEGNAEHLRLNQPQLDLALSALVSFRDPVGISAVNSEAHGNAFDRVSAFQDGYQQGAALCARFTVTNRDFTQRPFTSREDLSRGGNLTFADLIRSITPDLDAYFAGLVAARGGRWQPPQLRPGPQTSGCTGEQGPVAFCPAEGATIELDSSGQLPTLHNQIGDYSTATLLASRYSLAALNALGRPTEGQQASQNALCLAGTYTGELLTRQTGFGLSPGDLDEAVQVLLRFDYASRDVNGQGMPSGFERVDEFRAGALGGVRACGL